MESIEFFQVFIIIIILIMTLFYIYFRSLTSSSSSSSSTSSVAAVDTDNPPLQEKYDVFISFRGEDTRLTFTSHLYEALCRKKIETYIDDRLVSGGEITPALLEAIQRSTISVIIFSKNYASSTWCLDELVHILCKDKNGQLVIPIFYDISPSDVRKQQGSYALAFRQLEKRFRDSIDKVHNWRDALTQAANLSGFDNSEKTDTEASLVEKVVRDVLTKLNRESSSDLKRLVGIEKKIETIESSLCLDSPGVCCVGIWGMGGIGKTTLAEAVFHRHPSKFEAYCFLANVREKSEQTGGLNQLLNELVREILKDRDINIGTLSIGPTSIRDRLMRTKALIVLDDVNASNQLEVLVGDHDRFRDGSRIIITARDKGLLEQNVDHAKIFNVEGLSYEESLQLFHSCAFRNKSSTTDCAGLSKKAIDYSKGNPLALKVMGSLFHRCRSKQEWEDQWNNLKQFSNEEIEEKLRISYEGLGKNEKEIFLDIACFYKGYERNYVKELLDIRGFYGEKGINDLIDRSLISISKGGGINMKPEGLVEMHDLVQEMGRAIAREQRSRLFIAEDVYQVLTNDQRDEYVQAISFNWSEIEEELEHANFEKMYQLRWLHVGPSFGKYPLIVSLDLPNSLRYLNWYKYPLKSLPSKFSAKNLLVLRMLSSEVIGAQLWNEDQSPVNLKWICLSECQRLTEVPNLSRSLKIEHIDMNGCQSLVEIPSYFQHLGKLTYLDLGWCTNLKNLPEMPCNLEFLNLSRTAIEELPSSVWSHEKISHLDITNCKHLKSLPSNPCKLKLLGSLSLEDCDSLCEFWELPKNTTAIKLASCKNLVSLPTNVWKLKSLESLDLSFCFKFQNFPEVSEAMEHLEFLNLSHTAVKELPPSIGNLVALRNLDLSYCDNLVSLPTNIWNLKYLESLNLSCCFKIQCVSEISEAMEHQEFLKLLGTTVKELPLSLGNLVVFQKLDLDDCNNLEVVHDDLFCLTPFQELNLSWTKIKNIPASIAVSPVPQRLQEP
ncbi:unnamed protein product [Prunus armeniaca]